MFLDLNLCEQLSPETGAATIAHENTYAEGLWLVRTMRYYKPFYTSFLMLVNSVGIHVDLQSLQGQTRLRRTSSDEDCHRVSGSVSVFSRP